jgi:hypothetical protein
MIADPTHPSRATRQGPRLAAGAVEAPARARRMGRREHRSTSVQQAGNAAVDASATAMEDASLATSRWCRSRDCRRRATLGCPCCYCRSHRSCCSCFSTSSCPCPYPCICQRCWGWGRRGRGRLRTRQFLLRWAWRQLLLRRAPSSEGRGVEHGGLSLGRRVV